MAKAIYAVTWEPIVTSSPEARLWMTFSKWVRSTAERPTGLPK